MLENKPRGFYRCLPLQRRDCSVNRVDVASHDLSIDGTQTQTRTHGREAGNEIETELKPPRMRRGILFRTAAPYNGKPCEEVILCFLVLSVVSRVSAD